MARGSGWGVQMKQMAMSGKLLKLDDGYMEIYIAFCLLLYMFNIFHNKS